MPRRFPKTRPDGSFEVRVRFDAAPKMDLASIQEWVSVWVETHREWTILGQTQRFSESFSGVPLASVGETGGFSLVLIGAMPYRNFWRDWYVRLCRDLVQEFPELGELTKVEDVE